MTTMIINEPQTKLQLPIAPFDLDHIYELKLEWIESDDNWNCRGYIDPTSVLQLATDIRLHGLQSPVIVTTKKDGTFKLVAGYRRLKAHKMNRAETIRAIIRPGMGETESRIMNLTENIQREELNMLQEAKALGHIQFLPVDTIAQRVMKPVGWVQSRLALLTLPEEIQEEAAAGRITSTEVMKCSKLPTTELQFLFIRKAKDARLAGRKKVPNEQKLMPGNEQRLRTKGEIQEMQDLIRRFFGNGLATRALAWSGGFVTDAELIDTIKEEAASRPQGGLNGNELAFLDR